MLESVISYIFFRITYVWIAERSETYSFTMTDEMVRIHGVSFVGPHHREPAIIWIKKLNEFSKFNQGFLLSILCCCSFNV